MARSGLIPTGRSSSVWRRIGDAMPGGNGIVNRSGTPPRGRSPGRFPPSAGAVPSRIAALDILRGIAILGILFMNINDMGGSIEASFDDIRRLGWGPADQVAWWIREIFANGTTRCMLELLFGAGMVILTDRAAAAAGTFVVMKQYYLRNLILIGFGLIHVFILLWPGDILHTYGLAALIAFAFRRMPPSALLAIGLVASVGQFVDGSVAAVGMASAERAAAAIGTRQAAGQPIDAADRRMVDDVARAHADRIAARRATTARIDAENRDRSADTAHWVAAQWRSFIRIEADGVELSFVWEAVSVMLIGAALWRLGVIQGGCSRSFYHRLVAIGYPIGLSLRTIGAWEQTRFGEGPWSYWATGEIARIATTLGHLGLVHLMLGTATGARLLRPFAAAGRTALSIYVLQTLITLWLLFPPFGLALYGRLSWAPLMLLALAIDVMLLGLAVMWLRRFAIGPVEWAWRSLLVGQRLRWRYDNPSTRIQMSGNAGADR